MNSRNGRKNGRMVAELQNGRTQNIRTAEWQNGRTAERKEWQNGRTAVWQYGYIMNLPDIFTVHTDTDDDKDTDTF
jgi:hypothetical protein